MTATTGTLSDELHILPELDDLEKELSSVSHAHDPMNPQLQGGTRLQSRGSDEPMVPTWAWGVVGIVLVLLLLVIAVLVL